MGYNSIRLAFLCMFLFCYTEQNFKRRWKTFACSCSLFENNHHNHNHNYCLCNINNIIRIKTFTKRCICLWCKSFGIVKANRYTRKYKHFVWCIYYRIVCCLYAFNSFVWRVWMWFFSFTMFCPSFGHTKSRIKFRNNRNWSESFTTIHHVVPHIHTVNLVSLSLWMWTLCWCSHNVFMFPINHESLWISNFDSKLLFSFDIKIFPFELAIVWH